MNLREVVSLSQAMFGVRISLGSTQACCKAVSEAAAETTQAIHAEVKAAPLVHADETGFGRCGQDRIRQSELGGRPAGGNDYQTFVRQFRA